VAERREREGGGEVLVVRKVLHASAAFLFDAWTEPAVMALSLKNWIERRTLTTSRSIPRAPCAPRGPDPT